MFSRTLTGRRARRALAIAAIAALLPSSAQAAGLYFSDRGVRPLGRGGAFVAGADDLGAIWYNPAGLADAGSQFLFDASQLLFSAQYTRRVQVIDNAGVARTYESPMVRGTTPILPIPTIAASYAFGARKQFTLAAGLLAPYAAISSYPITVNGQPAASRYMLVSMDGSALMVPGVYFAYKPVEKIRLGVGMQMLTGKFASTVVFSASPPDRLISAPEDPSYDALSLLSAGPIFAPSGNMGIIAELNEHLRLGASAQLPFYVNAPASVKVRLPTAAPFDRARQEGDAASIRFRLPPIARAGLEFRTKVSGENLLRIEGTYVREFWSLHDTIDVRAENIKLYDVTGFPSPFGVAPISLPRGFQDSNSVRLGGEYKFKGLISDYWMDGRAGVAWESSAIPPDYVTPLTIDMSKMTFAIGTGLYVGQHWRFDMTFAYLLTQRLEVNPATARVPRVNPVQGNPTRGEAVNGGTYDVGAMVLGAGLRYQF